jgi:hypothetical protein
VILYDITLKGKTYSTPPFSVRDSWNFYHSIDLFTV